MAASDRSQAIETVDIMATLAAMLVLGLGTRWAVVANIPALLVSVVLESFSLRTALRESEARLRSVVEGMPVLLLKAK